MKRILCVGLFCVLMLTGCGEKIQNVSISIDNAENPVVLSVYNCEELEGKKDTIKGSEVTSNEKGNIIEVSSSSDFGDSFSGSYKAAANGLKNYKICFDVDKQVDEFWDRPVTCGVNYYDLVMNGAAKDADKILISYGKSIELQGVTGDFSAFVYVLSEDSSLQFGQSIITVSGTLEKTGNVTLECNGEKFILSANTEITNCKAVTENNERTEEFVDEADGARTAFEITVSDGKPMIK